MELFVDGQLSNLFEGDLAKLKKEVEGLSDQDILMVSQEEWQTYFVTKYAYEPIEVYENSIERDVKQGNASVDSNWSCKKVMVDGYVVTFKIPFTGNGSLLRYHPSSYMLCPVLALDIENSRDLDGGKIVYKLDFRREEINRHISDLDIFLKEQLEKNFKDAKQMIGYLNEDIGKFNASLENNVRSYLIKRKERADEWCNVAKALCIPLNLSKDVPRLHPIPLKKKVKKAIQRPTVKPLTPEYYISDIDYNNIVNIINMCCCTMERTARTYNKLEEEELRDIILATLGTHYENEVSGETFRKNGKTDILVTFDNCEAFVGECKIWHGIKAFNDAVDQLFSYTTWHDVKDALVIFNKKNKDFEKIQNEIEGWIKEHCQSYKRTKPNVWECMMLNPNQNNQVKLSICLYDIGVNELPSAKNR